MVEALFRQLKKNYLYSQKINSIKSLFAQDHGEIMKMLKIGSERAREMAGKTLSEVRREVGINYF